MTKIVVGIDGSTHSQAALEWAVEEAKLRDATVVLVHAFTPYHPSDLYGLVPDTQVRELIEIAEREVKEMMVEALDALGDRVEDVTVETVAARGEGSAESIIDRAGEADLIVVGSRGRGGFKGMLLGSVSQRVIQQAPCPVTVVREP